MVFLFPYKADVVMQRWPVANVILIVAMLACMTQVHRIERLDHPLILHGWSPIGLLGHMWLHAGMLHLLGNMLFLWVFGNAVCARVGNGWYVPIFVGLGIVAGIVHLICSGMPCVGASGAINGIVGMFLVFYPANSVRCVFSILVYTWKFRVRSGWFILFWLMFDIYGASTGESRIAYWAHLGGIAAGTMLALMMLKLRWVGLEASDRTLLDVLGHERAPVHPAANTPETPGKVYPQRRENVRTPFKSPHFHPRGPPRTT